MNSQLVHTVLDFPFPTIALLTGHTFGGACPFALAHDYRIMNSKRGFFSMPPVNLGLHFDGIGSLPRLKLRPDIAAKMLLEAHRWTGKEALADGIVHAVAEPEQMLDAALEMGRKWAPKAKMGYVSSSLVSAVLMRLIGCMRHCGRSSGVKRSRSSSGLAMSMGE